MTLDSSRPIPAPGHMGVDYESRVDFDRLRQYRFARAQAALEASECGSFLLFDFYNIRYTTSTWIGGALGDKMMRYCLLTRGREPDPVGLRLGGQAPQAQLELVRRMIAGAQGSLASEVQSRPRPGSCEPRSPRSRGYSPMRVSPTHRSASTSLSRPSCSRWSARV